MLRSMVLAGCLLLAAAAPGAAHHTWLRLLPAEVAGDAGLLILSFGHKLPFGEEAPAFADFRDVVVVSPDGQRRPVRGAVPVGTSSVAAVDVSAPGLWTAAAWREHYGCQTTHGYKRGQRREVEAAGFKVVECKHTFRYAKTYAAAGSGGPAEPGVVGHGLELVPGSRSAPLRAGDILELTVLLDGEPQPGFIVSGTCEGHSEELAHPEEREKFLVSGATGEDGRVHLRLDEEGWWFLIAEEVVEHPEPGVDKLYRSATLTLDVSGIR